MSLRGPAFILSNHVGRTYCIPAAVNPVTFEPAGMEASYLQTEEPSEKARITTLDPFNTRWYINFLTSSVDVDGLAIVNSNLSPHGYYRFVGNDNQDGGNYQTTLETAPSALANTSNVAGVVGDIDEQIVAPDSLFVGPSTTTNTWSLDIQFGTLSAVPKQGTAMAYIVIVAKLFGTPVDAYPVLAWNLRESGVDKGPVTSRAVTVSTGTGQVFVFPFNPADLLDPTMANVECHIVGYTGDGGGGGSYFKIDAVQLYYEDIAHTSRFDSGWLPRPLSQDATDYDGPQPTINLEYFLEDTVTLGATTALPQPRVTVMLLDDQADHDPISAAYAAKPDAASVLALRRTPDGFVDIGVAVIGPAVFLSSPSGVPYGSAGPQSPVEVNNVGGVSIVGSSYGSDSFRQRTIIVELRATREELGTLKDRIVFRRGTSGAFYFSAEPDIQSKYKTFNSGWWTVRSFGPESQVPMAYDDGDGTLLYTFNVELEEKL